MAIDNSRLQVLKKVLDFGCTSERAILDLTTEDMIGFCRSITDVAKVLELQKAVKEHRLIPYLISQDPKEKERTEDGPTPEDLS